MGKVCIYARVSTVDKQDYTRQVSDCKTAIGNKYSEENIEVFAERISGYKENEKRPELTKLLNIINNDSKYFDAIYITEISRLGRDPKVTRLLIDELTEKKIPIFITSINRSTLDENLERDSIMNIILQVLMEFADSESRTLKRRSKSGLLQSIINGNAGGSKNLPYGYRKNENKKLVVDEIESIVIKEIFDLYKNGNGVKKIASFLNSKGTPTRVNISFKNQVLNYNTKKKAQDVIWSDKTILDIIKNPIYKGQRRFKGNLYEVDSIISTELFDGCNDIIKTKTHRNNHMKYNYLLKDLLTCSVCGRGYFAKYKPVPGGDKVYICSSRLLKGGNCGNLGINIDYLESSILDMLKQSKKLLSLIDKIDQLKENLNSEIVSLRNEIQILEKSLRSQKNKESQLLKLYLRGGLEVDEYEELKEEVNKESLSISSKLELLNKRLFEQIDQLDNLDESESLEDMIKNLPNNRLQLIKIFKQLIKQVYIYKTLTDKEILLDVELNYGSGSFKMMLDLNVMKYKQPIYNYRVIGNVLNLEYTDSGVLTTDENLINKFFSTYIGSYKWNVEKENYLKLE
ncbi:recombinase family protein [Flavobacterium hibisci]|uniref:recombinase family protein n=1 Tax=Flavobacterium hibisci TaxID=1914462 RepID=UPI001CC13BFF|nr:recombinase family protein [Flavobacterium hibisci]MBZ4042615.1 recombinase family protein [Flavobacterium hibisci]